MLSVDLNCDMGESFGAFVIGQDAMLMEYISSVNIACGFHGGDPSVMKATVSQAIEKGLAIGAHPGYPDLQGFGRREMKISPDEVYDLILYQVGALMAFVKAGGTHLHHVKPHGALYNSAAKDAKLALAIAQAVKDVDSNLFLVGLSGSELINAANLLGLKVVSEVFADRTYQDDGSLTSRSLHQALITDQNVAAAQVLDMVLNKKVRTVTGKMLPIRPDSICIHGDGKQALPLTIKIVSTLKEHGISINRP
jgi:5-oxoprolinase (ATP-hydrolysing) subunit A